LPARFRNFGRLFSKSLDFHAFFWKTAANNSGKQRENQRHFSNKQRRVSAIFLPQTPLSLEADERDRRTLFVLNPADVKMS